MSSVPDISNQILNTQANGEMANILTRVMTMNTLELRLMLCDCFVKHHNLALKFK